METRRMENHSSLHNLIILISLKINSHYSFIENIVLFNLIIPLI